MPSYALWDSLEVGDRIDALLLGRGTVKVIHYTTMRGTRKAVWVWFDKERVRAGFGAEHAGYVSLGSHMDFTLLRSESNVVYGHCPECDEPDMIFYSEDYICAWCREHLEDS